MVVEERGGKKGDAKQQRSRPLSLTSASFLLVPARPPCTTSMPPRRKTQQPTLATALAKGTPAGKADAPPTRVGLAASGLQPPLTPEAVEARLRAFDLDSKFGPCVAITRRDRWERAAKLGLAPPPDVLALLDSADPRARQWSLWHGRV